MDSSNPQPRPVLEAVPPLDYEAARSPQEPRTPQVIAQEFARAMFLLTLVVTLSSMFLLSDEPPDPPLAAVCVVMGTSAIVTAIGAVTLWTTVGMRHALLRDAVRVRSQWTVVGTAAAYVAQIVAVGVAAQWLSGGDPRAAFWGYVPAVPLMAPLWIMPRVARDH